MSDCPKCHWSYRDCVCKKPPAQKDHRGFIGMDLSFGKDKTVKMISLEAYDALQAENKILREALGWYGDIQNIFDNVHGKLAFDENISNKRFVVADCGYKAREALAEADKVRGS